jgi:hypothetical protein
MAKQKITFEVLVEKALHQPGFFDGLKREPVKTLRAARLAPTPQVIMALKALDYDAIQNVAIACDPATGPIC